MDITYCIFRTVLIWTPKLLKRCLMTHFFTNHHTILHLHRTYCWIFKKHVEVISMPTFQYKQRSSTNSLELLLKELLVNGKKLLAPFVSKGKLRFLQWKVHLSTIERSSSISLPEAAHENDMTTTNGIGVTVGIIC